MGSNSTTSISGLSHLSSLIPGAGLEETEPQVQAIAVTDEENNSLASFNNDEETGGGLQSLSTLFASNMQALSASEAGFSAEELGNNLIAFSKLSEAKALLGENVTTRFFKKIIINGEVYLQPLKQKMPKDVDLVNISKNKPIYIPVGDPILYTPTELPNIDQFSVMHSSDQRALIQLLGKFENNTYSLTYYDTDNKPILTSVLSSNNSTIYVVEKLDRVSFSNMSYADQLAISKTPAFENIKISLGLNATKADIISLLDAELAQINNIFNSRLATATTAQIPGGPAPVKLTDQVGFFTRDHLKLFTDQIEMMRESIESDLAIYNRAQFEEDLSALMERFTRAFAFGDIPIAALSTSPLVLSDDPSDAVVLVGSPGTQPDGTNTGLTAYVNVLSMDKNKTIKAGFDNFILQEKTRIEAEKEVAALLYRSRNPDPDDPISIDGPQLMFQLQLYKNIISEADLACISEMVRQQNSLIGSYAQVQEAVGETMKTLASNGTARYLGVNASKPYTDETTLVISMFQNHAGEQNRKAPLHPIEKMRNISRPYIEAFSSSGAPNSLSRVEWSQHASQFKSAVGIIGQELQSNSAKANVIDKMKTRNSQLASQVNTRMYETIQQLARMGFW